MANRFRFYGQAIGAGGRINHPFHEFVEIQAMSALPEIGGHGSARSSHFRYRDILRFEDAYTEVTGAKAEEKDGKAVHKSLIRSRVEGVDIMGVVTADRIEARLVSFTENGHTCFKFTGSHFDNLKIAGVPVKVHLAVDLLDRLHNHEDVLKSYKDKKDFHTFFHAGLPKDRLKEAPERVQRGFPHLGEKQSSELPHNEGVTRLSLVRRLEPEPLPFPCWGHLIYIDGFGTIHLAELHLTKHKRKLSMLRVELGSPVDGDAQVCSIEGGGSPY